MKAWRHACRRRASGHLALGLAIAWSPRFASRAFAETMHCSSTQKTLAAIAFIYLQKQDNRFFHGTHRHVTENPHNRDERALSGMRVKLFMPIDRHDGLVAALRFRSIMLCCQLAPDKRRQPSRSSFRRSALRDAAPQREHRLSALIAVASARSAASGSACSSRITTSLFALAHQKLHLLGISIQMESGRTLCGVRIARGSTPAERAHP